MIYKNKHKYKTLEKRLNKLYVASYRGYKIKVNEMTFYVNEKTFKITEEQSGLGITPKYVNSIEDAEKYIEEIYSQIRIRSTKWLQDYPHLHMDLLDEGFIE